MKNFFITLSIVLLASTTMYAQHTETELVRDAFKLEKKAVVADFMQLNDSMAKKFWPIYNQYEAERAKIGDRKIALINKYADSYKNLDAATVKSLMAESASIQKAETSLREKYANMVRDKVSPVAALNFYMVEDYISTAIKMELYENVPAPGLK